MLYLIFSEGNFAFFILLAFVLFVFFLIDNGEKENVDDKRYYVLRLYITGIVIFFFITDFIYGWSNSFVYIMAMIPIMYVTVKNNKTSANV